MGNVFGSSNEGGQTPSFSYYSGLFTLKKTKCQDYLMSRSSDEGETAQILEPGTTAILRHKSVVSEMESYCQRWASGDIYRGNDIGPLRLNSKCKIWEDMSPPYVTLGTTVEKHAKFRPLMDKACEPGKDWDEFTILNHATKYLKTDIIDTASGGRGSLRIKKDVSNWTCMLLHKVMLNIDMTAAEAESFTNMQEQLLKIIILPDFLLSFGCVSNYKLKLQEVREWRKLKISEFEDVLSKQYDQFTNKEDLHFAAVGFLDTITMNIIAVTTGIHSSLAVLYSSKSPKPKELQINEENLPAFLWEVLRLYVPLSAVPYYNGPDQKQRKLLLMTSASRDPEVWGEDANEFRLRDLSQYRELSVLWGEKMVDKEDSRNNHVCPAKDLSYQMMLNFLKAFLRIKSQILVEESVKDITILPEINAGGKSLHLSEWEFGTTVQQEQELIR